MSRAAQLLRFAPAASYEATILADTPYAYWKLDEPSGTVAADSSGNNRHATYTGTFSDPKVSGFPGSATAPRFGAARSVLSDAVITLPNTYTMECWFVRYAVLPGQTSGHNTMIGGELGNTEGFKAQWGHGGVATEIATWYSGNGLISGYLSTTTFGTLSHYVATIGPNITQTYINGVAQGSPAAAVSTGPYNRKFPIGWDGIAGKYIDAAIGSVAAYPTALSPARILAHYTAGVS